MPNRRLGLKIANGMFCVIIKSTGEIVARFESLSVAEKYIEEN
jgi:hypothetical protein